MTHIVEMSIWYVRMQLYLWTDEASPANILYPGGWAVKSPHLLNKLSRFDRQQWLCTPF